MEVQVRAVINAGGCSESMKGVRGGNAWMLRRTGRPRQHDGRKQGSGIADKPIVWALGMWEQRGLP